MTFIIKPKTFDNQFKYEIDLWVKEECYRFYVEQRRSICNFLEILDLWLRAPYCEECHAKDPLSSDGWPDIGTHDWESDVAWELGDDILQQTKEYLKEDSDFCFICKGCSKELRPWEREEIFVAYYHLEEHYNIPLETPGKINPSKKLSKQIFNLYDYKCFNCRSSKELSIDHVRPRTKGGDSAFRNLQPLCKICNNKKADIEPEEVKVPYDMYFGILPSDGCEGLFW